jgi:hypothetical protein
MRFRWRPARAAFTLAVSRGRATGGRSEMTETTDQVQPAAPTKGKWWETPAYQRFHKWAMIVFAVIMLGIGALKMYHAFVPEMPSCSASETADVIRNIFKGKDVPLTKLSDMTLVNETSAERNCSARIETKDETAAIGYRITLEGKEFKVLITKVDAKPR